MRKIIIVLLLFTIFCIHNPATATTKKYKCGKHTENFSYTESDLSVSGDISVIVACDQSVTTNVTIGDVKNGMASASCSGNSCTVSVEACVKGDYSSKCCNKNGGVMIHDVCCESSMLGSTMDGDSHIYCCEATRVRVDGNGNKYCWTGALL